VAPRTRQGSTGVYGRVVTLADVLTVVSATLGAIGLGLIAAWAVDLYRYRGERQSAGRGLCRATARTDER
jgi:hypothetical protein